MTKPRDLSRLGGPEYADDLGPTVSKRRMDKFIADHYANNQVLAGNVDRESCFEWHCLHPDGLLTRTVESAVNCETTEDYCPHCGETFNWQTDCR